MYSHNEEFWNFLTHAFGLALSTIGLFYLVVASFFFDSFLYLFSAIVFGFSMIALYGSSMLYHRFRSPKLKQLFRLFDHSSIYILIAGTYTPVTLIVLSNTLGYVLLAVVWLLAFVGVVLELFLLQRIQWLSLLIYLGMGWLSIVAIRPMLNNMSNLGDWGLIAGGSFYSVGVIFYVWKSLPFNHAIWHVFVLLGTASHFFMVASFYGDFT